MPGGPERDEPARRRAIPAEDSGSPPRLRRAPDRAPAPVEAPVPEGPRLDLRVVVGGEWGLAGVQVLAVERFRDGSLIAMIGDDAPDGGETDGDGRITLRYKTEPAERLFGVLPDFGVLQDREAFEGAENAEAAGEIGPFRVFRALSTGPVTLRFLDPGGAVLLRPVDAETGEVLAGRAGTTFVSIRTEPGEEPTGEIEEADAAIGGWIRSPVDFGIPGVSASLLVPGYLPSPAPGGGWRTRSVLRLRRDPAAIRGRLAVSGDLEVSAVLRSVPDSAGEDGYPQPGLPRGPGEFALSGLPAGEWELVIRAEQAKAPRGEVSWAVRRFRASDAGLDLGDIVPLPGSVVRARLNGSAGRPENERGLVLLEGREGRVPAIGYERWRGGASTGARWPDEGAVPQLMGTKPAGDGWVEFRGLRPGASYILAAPWAPGVTKHLAAPAKPGEVLTIDLDGDPAAAACVVRFTVEGEEPKFWGGFTGPAFSDQFSTGKGVLEADIPPGRYRVQVLAAMGPEPDFRFYEGELEIPAPGRFEGTVDLQPQVR